MQSEQSAGGQATFTVMQINLMYFPTRFHNQFRIQNLICSILVRCLMEVFLILLFEPHNYYTSTKVKK
jgi:hypothetical protein